MELFHHFILWATVFAITSLVVYPDNSKKFNELNRALNEGIREGVEGSFFPERAKFMHTDKDITNTKFCMPGHTIWDQYFGPKVQLWNMSPEGVVTWNGGTGGEGGEGNSNGTSEVREPTPAEFDYWLETGMFTEDPREVRWNATKAAAAALDHADGAAMAWDPEWLDFTGPYQSYFPGMAQSFTSQIKRDYSNRHIINTNSIQIVFTKHNGYFAWFAFQGPQGIKVDPCKPVKDGFLIRIFYQKDARPDLSIDSPPYAVASDWWFNLGTRGSCVFKPDAYGPGGVHCDDGYVLDFQKDASWDDGVF